MKPVSTPRESMSLNQQLSLLAPGTLVTIEVLNTAGEKARCRALYVGNLPQQYLLLQFPDPTKYASLVPLLEPGVGLTVRGLVEGHEGAIIAFRSTIKQQLTTPSRLLVLSYPSQSQLQNLRTTPRIATQIPLILRVDNAQCGATMTDLSNKGCRVLLPANKQLALLNGQQVRLSIKEEEKACELEATICNVRFGKTTWTVGLMFAEGAQANATELLHQIIARE